jgi:hypothetical protein
LEFWGATVEGGLDPRNQNTSTHTGRRLFICKEIQTCPNPHVPHVSLFFTSVSTPTLKSSHKTVTPWARWPRSGPADGGGWNSHLWVELEWRRSLSRGSFLRLKAHAVVVHAGMLRSPLAHRLAHSIIVRPPDKHVVTQGGSRCLTAASPAMVV